MPRWYLPFETVNPEDLSKQWTVGIHQADYDRIRRYGHDKQVARILLVEEVFKNPTLLYKGWARRGKDDCFVYVGEPKEDYHGLRIHVDAPPPGMVFLVFVLPDGAIDDWNWRRSSSGDGKPDDVSGELIWQANQS